jgi:purine-binding chemotaxis protein CheW
MQIEEILIIKNGSENYGISTEEINQISRVPILMPLPLRPVGVRGLCSVGGNIVTIMDMNLLLEIQEVKYEAEKSRLISLSGKHSSSALLVSEVFNTVEVDDKNIEYINIENDPVIAIYKYNDLLVQVLSLDILVLKIKKVSIGAKEVKNGKMKTTVAKEEDSIRFLIFTMDNETFALNIEYLREIILADINFTAMVGSLPEVKGLTTLRDELIVVVDLRLYYGFNANTNDSNRVLIVSHNGKKIGLLVDGIVDIRNFLLKDIEYMSEAFEDNKVTGVIHDNNSLISFFDSSVLEQLFMENKSFIDSSNEKVFLEDSTDIITEVIVFKLSDNEYAFEVENVAEIIDIIKSTEVAFSNELVDGIINIRGQIVTIVSLFKKLNIPTTMSENSKIIICHIDDMKIGFVVDSVSDILSVRKNEIKEHENELFTNILHLDNGNRLVLSMDISKILQNKEQ